MKKKMLTVTWTQRGKISHELPHIGPNGFMDTEAIKRSADSLMNRLPSGVDIESVRFTVEEYDE